QGHDRVADEFVERAAVFEHDLHHFGEVIREQRRDPLGAHPLGHRGEAADVGEEDDDGALFARQPPGVLLLGDDLRDVGGEVALRTLWMRMDVPLKRSSAAALSERIATRSSTALRAIDWGTCFDAAAEPVLPLETRGTSSPDLSSSSRMDTRSTFMIWKVKSTTLSSSRSSSCCFDSSLEISRSSDSF